jgi:hypothetical protein
METRRLTTSQLNRGIFPPGPGEILPVSQARQSVQPEGAGSRRSSLPAGTVDFIAVHLIPEDTWCIIPLKEIEGHSTLHFTPGGRRQKYEKYKEVWELLKKQRQNLKGSKFQGFKVKSKNFETAPSTLQL